MKVFYWLSTVGVMLCLIVVFIACDESLTELLTVEVTIEEEIIGSDTFNEPPQTIPLIQGARIGGEGGLAKLPEFGFIERELDVVNIQLLHSLLDAGGAWIEGALINHADNQVDFSVFASSTSGLVDPTTATLLYTITIDTLETVNLADAAGLPAALADFLEIDTGDQLFLYFYAYADPDVDVETGEVVFKLNAAVHIRHVFDPSEYAEYADNLEEVIDAQVEGTVTNNGGADVLMQIFLTDEIRPVGDPLEDALPEDDMIIQLLIGDGDDVDLELDGNLIGESMDRLLDNLATLIEGGPVFMDLVLSSSLQLAVRLDNIRVTGTATATL